MGITRLNHAVLYVSDVEKSTAFYRDTLGFRPKPGGSQAVFTQAAESDNDHDLALFAKNLGQQRAGVFRARGEQPGEVAGVAAAGGRSCRRGCEIVGRSQHHRDVARAVLRQGGTGTVFCDPLLGGAIALDACACREIGCRASYCTWHKGSVCGGGCQRAR